MKIKLADDIFFNKQLLSLYKISKKSFIGEFKSAFKGLGLDFNQNRLFTENDSIKQINWNLFAKLRTLYIKEYIEDRNRFNIFALDISPSMFKKFGEKSKIEVALETTLTLLYSSLKTNDNTSLVLFTKEIKSFFPFNRKFNYFFNILNSLKSMYIVLEPAEEITVFLKSLYNILKKRTQIFLISDFVFDINTQLFSYLSQKHSLTSIIIIDEEEKNLSEKLKYHCSIEKSDIYELIPYHLVLENSIKKLKKINSDILNVKTSDDPFIVLKKFFENKIVRQY